MFVNKFKIIILQILTINIRSYVLCFYRLRKKQRQKGLEGNNSFLKINTIDNVEKPLRTFMKSFIQLS